MRVVIADDHEVVRIGLRTLLLQRGEDYTLVGEARNGTELLDVLAGCRCDLLILDFIMSSDHVPSDGIYLLRKLRERYPELPVVILTTIGNTALFRAMYAEGARAVVEKASAVNELIRAIQVVGMGRTYISNHMSRKLAEGYGLVVGKHATPGDNRPALSVREAEVVRLLSHGMSVSDIARSNGLSIKTISQQKRNAMHKLGLTSDRHLFEYASVSGLQKC